MSKKDFKINEIQLHSSDDYEQNCYAELDLRKELKKRLKLDIINAQLYDEIIFAFENNLPVINVFAEKIELITNEMVNWTIENIGNPNPQSGKKFDEIYNKYI
jgi:hypothetical protein